MNPGARERLVFIEQRVNNESSLELSSDLAGCTGPRLLQDRTREDVRSDLMGGAMGGLLSVPAAMAYAAIIFVPFGPEYLPMGVASCVTARFIVNAVSAFFRGTAVLLSSVDSRSRTPQLRLGRSPVWVVEGTRTLFSGPTQRGLPQGNTSDGFVLVSLKMYDLAKLALFALCLALIACQDANTGTESEACTDDGGVAFRICLTDDVGDEGAAAVMLGMSPGSPTAPTCMESGRRESRGRTLDGSPAAFFPFPAGSVCTLSAWDDLQMTHFRRVQEQVPRRPQ